MAILIQKMTATEAIVKSLKQRIQHREFGPGDRLPSEQGLLSEYGVSRLTLREALARLAALGVICVRHGKGAFVRSSVSAEALGNVLIPLFPQYDLNRMNDLVDARNMIEAEMAALAAGKRSEEQIATLEALLQFDEKTLETPEAFADQDYAFHLALAEMAGNRFLLAMYRALHSHIRAFLVQYARSVTDPKAALERHRPILMAIIDGDVEKARRLAREHARICASYINKMIHEENGETP